MRPYMIGTWALSLLVAVGWLGMADGGGRKGPWASSPCPGPPADHVELDAAPRPDVVSTTGGEASGPVRLGFPGGSDRG
jgi:hypothetical protein